MTTVYLDTSIIIDERFLRSAYAHAFFKACALLGIKIAVPEIVIDETKGNYPKLLKEKLSIFLKAHRELAKLAIVPDVDLAPAKMAADYCQWLDKFLDRDNVIRLPYPNVPLKELVEQSYLGQKPFKDTGEGHKDYLLWKALLEHCQSQDGQPPNFFLTKNSKDFCDEDGEGVKILHADLAAQITNEARRPNVYTVLKKFFDDHLAPHLEGMQPEDLPDLSKQDIENHATKVLEDELPQYSAISFEGVPLNDVTVGMVLETVIESIKLIKVDDEIVIEVSGRVDLELEGFIDKSTYYVVDDEDLDLHIIDGDWNDHVMQASMTKDTPFAVTLIYDAAVGEFSTSSIDLLEEQSDDWL